MTGGTASIFLAGILTKGEDARTFNNSANTNDERLQVEYVIDNESKSESSEASNCDMQDLYFVVDDEEIPNFYKEGDEKNFMSEDWKW